MEELEQLSLDERIENLKAIIRIAEYELSILLKQKEYRPVGFIQYKEEGAKTKKKVKK